MTSVTDKTILITGASRGLGRATAEAFLRAGAHVVATGRNVHAMLQSEAALKAIGGRLELVTLEVTNEAAVAKLIRSLERLDVLINNAGISQSKPFLQTSTEEFRRMLEVNVIGAFIVMREAARKMAAQGGGDVINIASTGALQGLPGMASYATSKHALLGLARSVRLELRSQGVRVMTVCPGPIKTEILGPEGYLDQAIEPHDLAETLVYIASARRSLAIQELVIVPTQLQMSL
jgi:NAD(P)-dependent dehydrogenase (short-subunit alcohol dehydrogenase family)